MKAILFLLALCPILLAGAKPMTDAPTLKFEDPAHGAFFQRARRCIGQLHPDWRHQPFKTGGNFYRARWCRGSGARDDCQIAAGTADNRDQEAVRLYTLFYGDELREVFGYGLQFLKTPKGAGWGLNVYLAVGGKSVVGEGFSLQFRRYPKEKWGHDLLLSAGSSASYEVARSRIGLSFGAADELRARLLKDGAGLQAGALAQIAALEAKVLAAIDGDEVESCDWGKYKNDGIPPPCFPRKLNPEEKAAELKKAKEFFSAQKQGWRDAGGDLWDLLVRTVPVSCLWPAS